MGTENEPIHPEKYRHLSDIGGNNDAQDKKAYRCDIEYTDRV